MGLHGEGGRPFRVRVGGSSGHWRVSVSPGLGRVCSPGSAQLQREGSSLRCHMIHWDFLRPKQVSLLTPAQFSLNPLSQPLPAKWLDIWILVSERKFHFNLANGVTGLCHRPQCLWTLKDKMSLSFYWNGRQSGATPRDAGSGSWDQTRVWWM